MLLFGFDPQETDCGGLQGFKANQPCRRLIQDFDKVLANRIKKVMEKVISKS